MARFDFFNETIFTWVNINEILSCLNEKTVCQLCTLISIARLLKTFLHIALELLVFTINIHSIMYIIKISW